MTSVDHHDVVKINVHPIRRVDSKLHGTGCFYTRSVEYVQSDDKSLEVTSYADTYAALMLPGETNAEVLASINRERGQFQPSERSQPNVIPPPEPMPHGDVI